MSLYREALHALENSRCMSCDGWGECDDADLGDIAYKRWNCHDCGGSGFAQVITVKTDDIPEVVKGAVNV